MQHFHEAGLPLPLLHRLKQIGFITPTPIQAKAIPFALEGKDILGSAQTGTGKTGAFGIPLIAHLMQNKRSRALVLLPTRELAAQVSQSLQQMIGDQRIKMALLIGGEPMPKQIKQLRADPRVIIATPGRMLDHLKRSTVQLHTTDFLVLDEVDRMLDMGFGIQLEAIAGYLTSTSRQTLMFSATLPRDIEKLSQKYLTDPVRIAVGTTNAPTTNVKQEQVKLSSEEKFPKLLEEIGNREGSIIVFVKTKRSADIIAKKLRKQEIEAESLHGDLRQGRRNHVIRGFRQQAYRVLVATDIAARGLDIPHIEHVINYDLPQSPEDYIHRIGRTARAGAKGEAINFLSAADGGKWKAIARLLNPAAEEKGAGRRKASGGGNRRPRDGAPGGSESPRRKGGSLPHWKRKKRAAGEKRTGEKRRSNG